MGEPQTSSAKYRRSWLRSLRPLLWWFLLFLTLFLYHTHERLSEKTLLKFSVTMGGKSVDSEATVTLDKQNTASGQRVRIGKHDLTISHPKAHAFSTNLFVWYGEHELGQIALERMRGQLEVQVVPLARSISVVGPEFSVVLTNSAGITSSIPTDAYDVRVHWANHDETRQLRVGANGPVLARFTPELGTLSFKSEPPGASVISDAGRTIGTTPLTLRESPAGAWKGELRFDGYISVPVSLVVGANQTNSFRTNLVNWQYAQAMQMAKTSFAAGNLEQTLRGVAAALKAQPDDSAALQLQQTSVIKQHLRNAEGLMAGENYDRARTEAEAVLELSPDNVNATGLLKEILARTKAKKRKEKEEAAAIRQKHLALAKEAFDYVLARHVESPMFEAHQLQAPLPLDEARKALYRELTFAPAFKLIREDVPTADSFAIFGALEIAGGLRRCIIVGTQIEDKETQIHFKVMEYKLKTMVGFQGQLTINRGYVALDASQPAELSEKERSQVKQGTALVEERLRRALASVPL